MIELNFCLQWKRIDGIVIDLGLDWEKFENKLEGKVFDGVISFLEEMKFKKDFSDKPLEGEKNDLDKFSPKTTRSNSGDEKTKS